MDRFIYIRNAEDDAYMNKAENFRGMKQIASAAVIMYFESAAAGGNAGTYDAITLGVTANKEKEAMVAIGGALAGGKSGSTAVIADDYGTTYCDDVVTSVTTISLATKQLPMNIIDWTADRTLLVSEGGSQVIASNVGEKHLQLPAVADAGAGWFIDVQLKVIQSGNATAILAAAGEFFFGALRIAVAGTVTEDTFVAVPTSTEDDVINLDLAIKGNLAGGKMRIICDGAAWNVDGDLVGSGTLHATNSIPFHTAES